MKQPVSAPHPPSLSGVMARNIHALVEMRRREQARRSLQVRIADRITAFIGSMAFVWTLLGVTAVWVVINAGLLFFIEPFDPYPFVLMAMVASVLALFLSTFVLITQNRMSQQADQRSELDLQISLLAEHEITRLVRLTGAIAQRLGIEEARDPSLDELKEDVDPEKVLDEMDRAQHEPQ